MNRHCHKTISRLAALAALGVLSTACERPMGQVTSPAPENYSRNVAPNLQPANELPRDADAAARTPETPALPSREAISDTVITARIKAALLTDPAMAGADVSVNTEHGVVILAGNVKSYEQTGIASAHAQRQDGVMRIDNQLTLVPQ
jgi:osmotically-inducible protein OsmY